ncbi:hypothetical protein [Bermanella sp. R86510]|uniref:hypothetical protein n=1 Tax=unclassified Bermanella TaxID=2627862 RepID=UPI0037C66FF9
MSLTTHKQPPAKICFLHSALQGDLVNAAQRIGRRLKREQLEYVAREKYKVPDSLLCKRALEMVSECSSPFLLNHGLRSYAFAVAMAHKVKKPFDKEVLFVGSVMHDLGLTDAHDHGGTFECDGARGAREFCVEQNMPTEKADLIHEMVALHNSVGIAHKKDPEIALLHFGAGLDVAALWIKDIHPTTLQEIIAEHPRLDFVESFTALLEDQLERKPDSYMKTMIDLGFLKKMRTVPF